MASKVKNSKVYIVLQGGNYGQPTTIGRYRVGAKNEREAEEILRNHLGKHIKARTYYEVKDAFMPHGMVIDDRKRLI
jgi:hypothetical protein